MMVFWTMMAKVILPTTDVLNLNDGDGADPDGEDGDGTGAFPDGEDDDSAYHDGQGYKSTTSILNSAPCDAASHTVRHVPEGFHCLQILVRFEFTSLSSMQVFKNCSALSTFFVLKKLFACKIYH